MVLKRMDSYDRGIQFCFIHLETGTLIWCTTRRVSASVLTASKIHILTTSGAVKFSLSYVYMFIDKVKAPYSV